jgi:hypothetical protein
LLNHSFLSCFNALPTARLSESLVSSSRRRHARHAACRIARFFLVSTPCPRRRSLNRSFLSSADDTPVALIAKSLVSFSFQSLVRRTAF